MTDNPNSHCYKVIYHPDVRMLESTSLPTIPSELALKYLSAEVTQAVIGPIFAWNNEMAARRDFFGQLEANIRTRSQVWECTCGLHPLNGIVPKILNFDLLSEKQATKFWQRMAELKDARAIHSYYRDKEQAYRKHKKNWKAVAFMEVPKYAVLCSWVKPVRKVE